MHQSARKLPSGPHGARPRASALGLLVVLLGLILPAGVAGAARPGRHDHPGRALRADRRRARAARALRRGRAVPADPGDHRSGPSGCRAARAERRAGVIARPPRTSWARDAGWYLDYPGNPLAPHCDYETWFRQASAGTTPTLYSRIATDPEHPDKLALQYWFFYTFNDWNDKHEGDWEMVQLLFPAATPEEALTVTPVSVAYAQHEGSQVARGTRPG